MLLPENTLMHNRSSSVLPSRDFHAPGGSQKHPHTTTDKNGPPKSFVVFHPEFLSILGKNPALCVLYQTLDGLPLFHEAGVHVRSTSGDDLVYFTSNLLKDYAHVDGNGMVSDLARLSNAVVPKVSPKEPWTGGWTDLPLSTTYPAPNGAFPLRNHIILCDQGHGTEQLSSLVAVDTEVPHNATPLLNNFYGRRFNSLNDVVILSSPARRHMSAVRHPVLGIRSKGDPYETIWFTDPHYGSEQEFKPPPELPPQVYCFDPWTGSVRAVADGFIKPNGIAFDTTGTKCYITDTGIIRGDGVINGHLPGSIYVFDVAYPPPHVDPAEGGPQLVNRRLFSFTDSGAPDGIKMDTNDNVYAGCFDGIHVWNKYGTLLGKILFRLDDSATPDGCANFCFLPGGRIVGMSEDKMYLVEGLAVEGALVPVGASL